MKFIALILALTSPAYAIDHSDVVKAMKKPKGKMEVMSISPLAHPILMKDLISEPIRQKIDEEKKALAPEPAPSVSPKPVSLFSRLLPSAYAFTPAKPVPPPAPIPTPTTLPQKVDLRANDTPVINQWNGTCTAHATTAALENLLKHQVNLSERYHWSTYQVYSSESSVNAAQKNPLVLESVWPHEIITKPSNTNIKPQYQLSSVEYLNTDLNKLKAHLATGRPAIVAMSVPKDMMSCMSVIRESTEMDNDAGHALEVVGYGLDSSLQGGGYFTVKNSWSTGCGDAGYQYIPFSVCKKTGSYCIFWAFKEVKKVL